MSDMPALDLLVSLAADRPDAFVHGVHEVTPMYAYRKIFQMHDVNERSTQLIGAEVESRDFVGNPLGYCCNNDDDSNDMTTDERKKRKKKHGHFRILFYDTFEQELTFLHLFDFAIISGLSYFGRRPVLKHASKLFAFIIDLDDQNETTLTNFLWAANQSDYKVYPMPNFIVASGHGVHLYYVMEEPISLYPEAKARLRRFKFALIDKIWNKYTSNNEDPQYQGIAQGFRVIGGKTKIPGYRSRVFEINMHPWTLAGLNEYLPADDQISDEEIKGWEVYRKTPIGVARRQWPDWYKRRIIEKKPKNTYQCNRKLYDWWIKQILEGATFGHRYFCVMCLAIFGIKCGVSREEVEQDAQKLKPFFNTIKPEEPFTDDDIANAMRCYDKNYATFPRETLSKISGIEIKPQRRNGRPQELHLKIARSTQEIINPDWRQGNGRPSKRALVEDWQKKHPGGRKADCARELKIGYRTVLRHWQ